MFRLTKFVLLTALSILWSKAFAQSVPVSASNSLLVNVLDRQGNAVRDLAKNNFRVKIDKQPVEVLDATYSVASRKIVVLLDMSSSMIGTSEKNNKWRVAREAVEDLFTQAPADVPIAMLTFSDEIHDQFDFQKGRSTILKWFDDGPTQRSDVKGRTALHDAIIAGVNMLQPFHPGDAIYAITDGGDNASHASLKETETALHESGTRLFVFFFSGPFAIDEEEEGARSLIELVDDSGGFVFGIGGGQPLANIPGLPSWDVPYGYNDRVRDQIKVYTQALNDQIKAFYVVQIDAAVQRGKKQRISLEIVDAKGKRRKDTSIASQRFLPTNNH